MPLDLQRPRDLGRILDDAFGFYRVHWKKLLTVSAVVVVPVFLLVYGVGLGWLWEGYDKPSGGDVKLSDLTDNIAGLVAQLLVVTPLVTAMTVHVVRSSAAGREPSTGEAVGEGLAAFSRLFLPVVLVALGVGLGLFALLIPGIYLAAHWMVVPQVVILEDRQGAEALQRSMALTRGQGWFAFLVWLVTNLLVAVLSSLLQVPLAYAAEHADSQAILLGGQILGA